MMDSPIYLSAINSLLQIQENSNPEPHSSTPHLSTEKNGRQDFFYILLEIAEGQDK